MKTGCGKKRRSKKGIFEPHPHALGDDSNLRLAIIEGWREKEMWQEKITELPFISGLKPRMNKKYNRNYNQNKDGSSA
jgi:hypothetical protein